MIKLRWTIHVYVSFHLIIINLIILSSCNSLILSSYTRVLAHSCDGADVCDAIATRGVPDAGAIKKRPLERSRFVRMKIKYLRLVAQ